MVVLTIIGITLGISAYSIHKKINKAIEQQTEILKNQEDMELTVIDLREDILNNSLRLGYDIKETENILEKHIGSIGDEVGEKIEKEIIKLAFTPIQMHFPKPKGIK